MTEVGLDRSESQDGYRDEEDKGVESVHSLKHVFHNEILNKLNIQTVQNDTQLDPQTTDKEANAQHSSNPGRSIQPSTVNDEESKTEKKLEFRNGLINRITRIVIKNLNEKRKAKDRPSNKTEMMAFIGGIFLKYAVSENDSMSTEQRNIIASDVDLIYDSVYFSLTSNDLVIEQNDSENNSIKINKKKLQDFLVDVGVSRATPEQNIGKF